MANVPNVSLNNGVNIPQIGYGVFQVPPAETQESVEAALMAGYRHIDTAAAYRNESGVGAAITASGLSRDEVFITTKLRNGEQDKPLEAFDNSLRALGVDHVDLYLIHWPAPEQGLFIEAWKALEKIYAEGSARAIGVSNFLPEHLDALREATEIVPAVNQIELHPTLQQTAAAEKSRSLGIAVEAYSPLGQGSDLTNPVVRDIATKHNATAGQIVLAWNLHQGNIVIPKTVQPARMKENLEAADILLSPEEIEVIGQLESGNRVTADPATANFTQM
ncbi:aldo/keto reductase [Arthrobacter sp. H14]|uniref:aldo/keto reductase n=1 Tax=Arthrobacter sp. H14 TaxID=1312959 RepID=UPI00047AD88F|nr:aldo/keto reductase [Arthrobacter sp. H14]